MGKGLRSLAWLVPLGAAALTTALGPQDPADLPYFADGARTLFSPHWVDTFSDPSLQVGPLMLAFVGAGDRIGGLGLLAYAIQVGLAALFVFVVGRLLRGRPFRSAAQTVVGLAAVALGLTTDAYAYGHPAQIAVPLLWILAGVQARQGRVARSGALLGLSAGLEVWGVLGAPVLLLAPSAKRALAGVAAQAVVVAILYLPFALAGDFRMLEYRWKVEEWTLVGAFLPAGSDFPWALRVVQGACAALAGFALALVLRHSVRAVWAVPFAVVVVRVLLDPTLYTWYWLGVATVALLGAAELVTSPRARWQHSGHAPGYIAGERRA